MAHALLLTWLSCGLVVEGDSAAPQLSQVSTKALVERACAASTGVAAPGAQSSSNAETAAAGSAFTATASVTISAMTFLQPVCDRSMFPATRV